VAQKMKDIGFSDAVVLKGGWKAWVMTACPAEPIQRNGNRF
jgi:rhodanese-related sulfurtransferase